MARGLRRSRLVSLVRQFVEADSWSASRVFVERHPALLSADADEILADLQAVASARGDSAAAHTFEVHQAALRRYRELGAAVFDELIAPDVPATLRSQWAAAEDLAGCGAAAGAAGRPGRRPSWTAR